MSYHKNKQQAFQVAEQDMKDVFKAKQEVITLNEADYSKELAHLKGEIDEAYQQVTKALDISSDKQAEQLKDYRDKLEKISIQTKKTRNI